MRFIRIARCFLTSMTVTAFLLMSFALSTVEIISPGDRRRQLFTQMQVKRKGDDEPLPVPWAIPETDIFADPNRYSSPGYFTSNLTFSPGIGNLMFQYASLLALSLKTNRTLVLHSETYLRRAFKLKQVELASPEVANGLLRTWSRHKFPLCCKYNENITRLLMETDENLAILGYFQSFRYFDEVRGVIQKEFTFLPEIRSRAAALLSEAMSREWQSDKPVLIGVHVRHGIELTWNTRNKYHGHTVANSPYYHRAMDHFRAKYGNVLFIMTTDDPFYTKQWLQFNDSVLVTSDIREVDMCLLTLCNHTIMSTGTFGWWAAYLTGGDVVYYKNWPLQNSKLDSMVDKDDFFPKHWTAL